MKGSGKDENKRAPMYWSTDPDAEGMCDGPEDMDQVKMKFGSLEEQEADETSVYSFYKKVIDARNRNPEIAKGTVETIAENEADGYVLESGNGDSVCVLRKTYEESEVLLVFVTGGDAATIDLRNITLNGKKVSKKTAVRAALTTGEEDIQFETGVVQMPGYSVLVLK
jgi:glycosidase